MEYTTEIWKDIKGYEGLYQVSNLGRVKSLDRTIKQKSKGEHYIIKAYKGKTLKKSFDTDGYLIVSLYDSKRKMCTKKYTVLLLKHSYQTQRTNLMLGIQKHCQMD